MKNPEQFFIPYPEEHVQKEKRKAKDLRRSQWWKNVLGRGVCYYCNEKVSPHDLTMDHVVPIIRGGKSSKGNVVSCCKGCNSKKKYLLPIEWQDYLTKLSKATGQQIRKSEFEI